MRGSIVLALLATLALFVRLRRVRRERAFEPRVARLPEDAFPQGERAPLTAFYFTSRLCGACQDTPRVVREADAALPLVALPVHERPDLARAVGVFETPTLLLADAQGRIRYARVGNPEPGELRLYVAEAALSAA